MTVAEPSNGIMLGLRTILVTIIVAFAAISSLASYHSQSYMHLPLKDNFGAKVGIDLGALPLDQALEIAAEAHSNEQLKKESEKNQPFELQVVFPVGLDKNTKEQYLNHLMNRWGNQFPIHKIKIVPIYFDINAAQEDIKNFRANLTNAMLQDKSNGLRPEQQAMINDSLKEFDAVEKDLNIWKKSISFWKQRLTNPDQIQAIGKFIGMGKGISTAATWFGNVGGFSALSNLSLGLVTLASGGMEVLGSATEIGQFASENSENIRRTLGGALVGGLAGANAYIFVHWAKSWSNWKSNHQILGTKKYNLNRRFKIVAKYNNSPLLKSYMTGVVSATLVSVVFRGLSDAIKGNAQSVFTPEFWMGQGILALGSSFFDSLTDVGSKTLEKKGYVNGHTKQYLLWLPGLTDTFMWLAFRTGNMPLTYTFGAVSWGMRSILYGVAKILPDRANHIVSVPGFIPPSHSSSAKSLVNVEDHLSKESFEEHMNDRKVNYKEKKKAFFEIHKQAESIRLLLERSQRLKNIHSYRARKYAKQGIGKMHLSLKERYESGGFAKNEFLQYLLLQETKLSRMSLELYYSLRCSAVFKK